MVIVSGREGSASGVLGPEGGLSASTIPSVQTVAVDYQTKMRARKY